jgi:hypothetical protein
MNILKDLVVNGMIIIKYTLNKYDRSNDTNWIQMCQYTGNLRALVNILKEFQET